MRILSIVLIGILVCWGKQKLPEPPEVKTYDYKVRYKIEPICYQSTNYGDSYDVLVRVIVIKEHPFENKPEIVDEYVKTIRTPNGIYVKKECIKLEDLWGEE